MKRTLIGIAIGVLAIAGCSSEPESDEPVRTESAAYSSCDEAKADNATPLFAGDPGWNARLDRDGDGVACDDGATEPPAATTAAATPSASPAVQALTVALAESNAGISIAPVDLGPELVDNVDSRRMIIDTSNWTIVAQCDQMGEKLTVGAIQTDEWRLIQSAGFGSTVSDNSLQHLLDCP